MKIGEKVWMAENLNFDIPEGFRLPTKEVFDELVASVGGGSPRQEIPWSGSAHSFYGLHYLADDALVAFELWWRRLTVPAGVATPVRDRVVFVVVVT
ncbi:hypothetical protein [Fibrobacter sp. UWP2]|uniref:hypothetical protein n=1 Tax=Fibrobacter sp. UWP2 TaxID=1896216 RepID=UPI001F2BCFA7|nr:hypothetical protein [Fibrobacter sp. UWP2]